MKMSPQDTASIVRVLGVLEQEAVKLGSVSRIAHLWRDWTDLLAPSSQDMTDPALGLALVLATPSRTSGILPTV